MACVRVGERRLGRRRSEEGRKLGWSSGVGSIVRLREGESGDDDGGTAEGGRSSRAGGIFDKGNTASFE